jgi:hypothetical protein
VGIPSSPSVTSGQCTRGQGRVILARQNGAGHFVTTWATGKRLICSVPLSTRPIMVRAAASMQIVITRLLRSLILGNA